MFPIKEDINYSNSNKYVKQTRKCALAESECIKATQNILCITPII